MHAHLLITSAKKSTPNRKTFPPLPTSSQHHLCFQSEISRRAAGTQRVRPRNRDPLVASLIEARECPRAHGQSHIGLGAGLSVDYAKGGQHAERTARFVIPCREVYLHDLPTGWPARGA